MTSREQFEEWISGPPFEKPVERFPKDSGWSGMYRAYEVQVAWEAWQCAFNKALVIGRQERANAAKN